MKVIHLLKQINQSNQPINQNKNALIIMKQLSYNNFNKAFKMKMKQIHFIQIKKIIKSNNN